MHLLIQELLNLSKEKIPQDKLKIVHTRFEAEIP